uniref:Uncharacterized protein n=1 Tax=Glossina austeni TaxID=7395 RepID=A0A1A9VBK3_GLOAU
MSLQSALPDGLKALYRRRNNATLKYDICLRIALVGMRDEYDFKDDLKLSINIFALSTELRASLKLQLTLAVKPRGYGNFNSKSFNFTTNCRNPCRNTLIFVFYSRAKAEFEICIVLLFNLAIALAVTEYLTQNHGLYAIMKKSTLGLKRTLYIHRPGIGHSDNERNDICICKIDSAFQTDAE